MDLVKLNTSHTQKACNWDMDFIFLLTKTVTTWLDMGQLESRPLSHKHEHKALCIAQIGANW